MFVMFVCNFWALTCSVQRNFIIDMLRSRHRCIFFLNLYEFCLYNSGGTFFAECFIPDKTRTASLLNDFKSEPFRKFIDVNILKIDLVWAVKPSKKFIENSKRVSSIYKDTH